MRGTVSADPVAMVGRAGKKGAHPVQSDAPFRRPACGQLGTFFRRARCEIHFLGPGRVFAVVTP